ncbi:MAG TPA: RluA family pseudouridine synthase [Firmicutes bacterium]|nr:RluA family pseudouridine synthase [Bacillota bacterium]
MEKYIVKENEILIEFLKKMFSNLSKNSVKSLLHNEKVFVNGNMTTKYNYELNIGDVVEIREKVAKNIDIIYEDKDIIVINKPSGLLTVATEKEKNKTAYHLVMEYLKKKNKNNRIFIIHRLDKDTSGIIMFAKNERAKHLYQDNWNDIVKKRCYYAVIDGKMENKEGTIKSYLKENGNMVYSVKDRSGKLAITEYKVLKERKNISLLDINLKTGRKNQIRVHMKENKTPILGDLKYGEKSKLINRLALHAYKLELVNPVTKKLLTFEINMPNEFKMLFK